MSSVGLALGSTVEAAVSPPPSSVASGRRLRRTRVAATRGGQAAPKKEKGVLDFIVGAIFKEEQLLVETDPLLNKIDASGGGTTSSGGKKPAADGGDGFSLGGIFAKKD